MKTKNKCEFVIKCHLFDAIDLHKMIFVVNNFKLSFTSQLETINLHNTIDVIKLYEKNIKQFCKMMVMIEKTNNFTII
jgi:hypothetical protein